MHRLWSCISSSVFHGGLSHHTRHHTEACAGSACKYVPSVSTFRQYVPCDTSFHKPTIALTCIFLATMRFLRQVTPNFLVVLDSLLRTPGTRTRLYLSVPTFLFVPASFFQCILHARRMFGSKLARRKRLPTEIPAISKVKLEIRLISPSTVSIVSEIFTQPPAVA